MAGKSFASILMRQSSWYFLCNALNNGLAIILLPFLSHYLTTEEYGIVQLSTGIGLFLPMLFCAGIDKSIYRFFHEFHDDKRITLISSVYWFVIISGLIVLSIFAFSSFFWFEPFLHIKPYPYCLLFAYPYLLLQLATIGLSVCQQTFSLKTMTFIEVIGTVVNLSLSILFVVYVFEDGAVARLLAIFISYLIKAFAYTCILINKKLLKFKLSIKLLKESIKYSLPLLPNSIALWLIRTFDRVLVSYFCGPAICGEYSVGVQVSFVVYFVQDSVMQALGPLQIKAFIEDKVSAIGRLMTLSRALWIIMGVVTFVYCTICPELMKIFLGKDFIPSFLTIIFLTTVYTFQAQYRLFSDILSYHKATKWFMYAGITQATLGLALNLILIPKIGYDAAGISNLISVFVYTSIVILASLRYEDINIPFFFYLKHLLVWVFFFGAIYYFKDDISTKYLTLVIFLIIYLIILKNEIKNRHIVLHVLK